MNRNRDSSRQIDEENGQERRDEVRKGSGTPCLVISTSGESEETDKDPPTMFREGDLDPSFGVSPKSDSGVSINRYSDIITRHHRKKKRDRKDRCDKFKNDGERVMLSKI